MCLLLDCLIADRLAVSGPVGFGRLFIDEPGFVEAPVGGLQLFAVDGLQLFAVVDQDRPQSVEDAPPVPAAHGPMYRRVAAELFRQVVPLTAGAGAVDHAVQAPSLIRSGTRPMREGGSSSVSSGRKSLSHSASGASQIVGNGSRGTIWF